MRSFSHIRRFKKAYSNLYKITCISCFFIIIYISANCFLDLCPFVIHPFVDSVRSYKILNIIITIMVNIWPTLFNVCLAIIANTLFCYYQIFLPQQSKRDEFKSTILLSLKSIRRNMSMDIEELYKINHSASKNFEDMDEKELGTLCKKGLDNDSPRMKRTADSPDESNPRKYYLEHISILESLHESAIFIKQECQRLLNLYSSVMETDEFSFLIHLTGSNCLSLFESYFTFNKPLEGISFCFADQLNPYLVDFQRDYVKLLKFIQKYENEIRRG